MAGAPHIGLILCLAGLAGLAGCADESRRAADYDSQRHSVVAALIAQDSASSLATAAVMSRLDTPASQSAELIARAVAMAPDRPELLWVQWRVCAPVHCADEERIRAHLKAVDPDNGLAWMPDLEQAWARQSPSDVTAVVAQIGAGRHMRIYWNSATVMMVDSLTGIGDPPRHSGMGPDIYTRMVYASGILAAVSIPPLQPLSKACQADQLHQAGRRAACEAMVTRLQASDSVLTQGLGLSLQAKWWPEGSAGREALLAQHRQLEYLMMASSRTRLMHMNRDAATRIEAARRYQNETDVMRAMLTSFHEPVERPADWKDPYLRYDK
jgi:hypothetical protein